MVLDSKNLSFVVSHGNEWSGTWGIQAKWRHRFLHATSFISYTLTANPWMSDVHHNVRSQKFKRIYTGVSWRPCHNRHTLIHAFSLSGRHYRRQNRRNCRAVAVLLPPRNDVVLNQPHNTYDMQLAIKFSAIQFRWRGSSARTVTYMSN